MKNNLQVISSLLDMQSRQLEPGDTLDAFRDSISRIRAMALIHEKLYESEQLDEVPVDQYLEELVQYLIQSHHTGECDIRFDVDPIFLPTGQSISLGMIVNELVSNSIQHGFGDEEDGLVAVRLQQTGDNTGHLVIEDDGHGVADDIDLNSVTSVGMKVVRSLTEHDLDGEIAFDTDDGLRAAIEFPLDVGRG